MSSSAKSASVPLKDLMPATAQWVREQRKLYGDAWVSDCIRRAKAGEPGLFYAMEAGHVVGTPFPASHPFGDVQNRAVVLATNFAGFIAQPSKRLHKDGHGTH